MIEFHHNPLSLSQLITALVSFALAIWAWNPGNRPRSKYLTYLMSAICLWSIAYSFELASTTYSNMIFWLRIEYLAIPFVPILWLLLVLNYSGLERLIKSWNVILLALIPFFTILLFYTNSYHHLYYKSITVSKQDTYLLLALSFGFWYHINTFFSYLLITISIVILVYKLFFHQLIYRKQCIFMLVAVFVPLVLNFLYFFKLLPFSNLDPTPFSFTIAGILIAVSIFNYSMFDLFPVAHEYVFENMNDGVIIVDSKKRFVLCNKNAIQIFDWKFPPIGETIDEKWNNHSELIELSTTNKPAEIEYFLIKNNIEFVYEIYSSDIHDRRNRFLCRCLVFHDITLKKKTEENLRQSNVEKDKFLSVIAHGFRGPVSTFLRMTDILTSEEELGKDIVKKIFYNINNTAVNLNRLLDNLIEWSKIQHRKVEFKPEKFSILALINQSFENFRELVSNKQIEVINIVPENLNVYADPSMTSFILKNLFSNAVKFNQQKGKIIIDAKLLETNKVEIFVSDTGIGMNEQYVKDIFRLDVKSNRLGTKSEPGTGLGLILCKEYVEKQNGKIFINSIENEGTTVSFTLDYSPTF